MGLNFKLNKQADTTKTTNQGSISISPKRLTEVFGQPSSSDGYKTSGEYVFTSESGDVFTVSDYKSTSLYDDEMISPEEFWDEIGQVDLEIGATSKNGVQEFKSFLEKSV